MSTDISKAKNKVDVKQIKKIISDKLNEAKSKKELNRITNGIDNKLNVLKEKKQQKQQSTIVREDGFSIQKLSFGDVLITPDKKVVSFVANESFGLKKTFLQFDENHKPHGKCYVNGKKYNFQHGIKK